MTPNEPQLPPEPLIQTEEVDAEELQEQLTECLNRISQLTTELSRSQSTNVEASTKTLTEIQNLRIEVRNLKEQLQDSQSSIRSMLENQPNPDQPQPPNPPTPEVLNPDEEADRPAPRTPPETQKRRLRKI